MLPERAFERILPSVKVKAFVQGEEPFVISEGGEFHKYFGYVVKGRMVFLNEKGRPLGMAVKDEFFLGRPFTLLDQSVEKIVSASDISLVAFVPKEVISELSKASDDFSQIIEGVYHAVFERSEVFAEQPELVDQIQKLVEKQTIEEKSLSQWLQIVEEKRKGLRKNDRALRLRFRTTWIMLGIVSSLSLMLLLESLAHHFELHSLQWYPEVNSRHSFLILLGLVSSLLALAGGVVGLVGKKIGHHWTDEHLYPEFGKDLFSYLALAALSFIFFSFESWSAMMAFGSQNILFFALLLTWIFSIGFRKLTDEIPDDLEEEKVRLDQLKAEQRNLQRRAESLMDHQRMFKTSVALISQGASESLLSNFFYSSFVRKKRMSKVEEGLKALGLGTHTASQAAAFLADEFAMRRRIQFYELNAWAFRLADFGSRIFGGATLIAALIHLYFLFGGGTLLN